MASKRKLEAAIARVKGGVSSLLMLLILFYCIALAIAGLAGIVLFVKWILRVV